MEFVDLLARYPASVLIFVAWPLLFIWLLQWVVRTSAQREERLLEANTQLSGALERLADRIDSLGDQIAAVLREVARR